MYDLKVIFDICLCYGPSYLFFFIIVVVLNSCKFMFHALRRYKLHKYTHEKTLVKSLLNFTLKLLINILT